MTQDQALNEARAACAAYSLSPVWAGAGVVSVHESGDGTFCVAVDDEPQFEDVFSVVGSDDAPERFVVHASLPAGSGDASGFVIVEPGVRFWLP